MKSIYIYNPHNKLERDLIIPVEQQLGSYVMVKSLDDISDDLKQLVTFTPCLIFAPSYLQGEQLLNTSSPELLLVSELYKALEDDERYKHEQDTARLDYFVMSEKTKSIDEYTVSLIESGVL